MRNTAIAAFLAFTAGCAASSMPTGHIRVTAGSADMFRDAKCYGASDFRDKDDGRVTLSAFEYEMLRRSAFLKQCGIGDALVLSIAYQAGRGVCVDCELPKNRWSGFAFVTISSRDKEIAAAEWQGEGAMDGSALLRRFIDDLQRFLRRE